MEEIPEWEIQEGEPCAVVTVDSWSQYLQLIETDFLDWPEYIYRGQREATWSLRSDFDRRFREATELVDNNDPLEGLDAADRCSIGLAHLTLHVSSPCAKPHRHLLASGLSGLTATLECARFSSINHKTSAG